MQRIRRNYAQRQSLCLLFGSLEGQPQSFLGTKINSTLGCLRKTKDTKIIMGLATHLQQYRDQQLCLRLLTA